MTIKIIDLYIKIANNIDVPKRIKYYNNIFEYSKDKKRYLNTTFITPCTTDMDLSETTRLMNYNYLTDEVEILDEPNKIEKLSNKTRYYFTSIQNGMTKKDRQELDDMFDYTFKTIDLLIDKVNGLDKEDENSEDNINILTTMRNNKMLDLLSLKAQNLNDIATNVEKQIKALDYSLAQNKSLLDIKELIKKQLISNANLTKYTDEMCFKNILNIINKALDDNE